MDIYEQGISQHRISVIVHRSAGDKLAVESFTRLACFGPSLIPVKERERVTGKVQLKVSHQRFVNSCLANSLSVTLLYVPHNFIYA